jgi:glycolate oxidase
MVEGDIVVPRSKITSFLQQVRDVLKKCSLSVGIFGHLGDGNVHINILKGEMEDEKWERSIRRAIEELFNRAIYLGGKISGEHGIGLIKKPYLSLVVSEVELNLMRKIKRVFDPNNVLNPGKIFD